MIPEITSPWGEEHQFDGITDEDRKQVWGMFADNDQQVRTMSGRGSNWLLEKVSDAITRVLDYSQRLRIA